MIIYFSFQETPQSSIYKTQVIDVVNYLNKTLNKDVRLFALIPVKDFLTNRRTIKANCQVHSYIWPQLPLPRMWGWKYNALIVWVFGIFIRPSSTICRSIFATWLAIKIKPYSPIKKVVFDSRGIITEEAREYGVYPEHIQSTIENIENTCVHQADFLMVITEKMIEYFRQKFDYEKNDYVVIPCSLGSDFETINFDDKNITAIRTSAGFSENDIVLVYSGSNAKWQSFDTMLKYAEQLLEENENIKLLLLSKTNGLVQNIIKKFPERVFCKWLLNAEVKNYLVASDYALIIRDGTLTNSVCSPTKFAEYLSCGLPVIASDTMAINDIIINNNAGVLINLQENSIVRNMLRVPSSEKKRLHQLALELFSKSAIHIVHSYQKVLEN